MKHPQMSYYVLNNDFSILLNQETSFNFYEICSELRKLNILGIVCRYLYKRKSQSWSQSSSVYSVREQKTIKKKKIERDRKFNGRSYSILFNVMIISFSNFILQLSKKHISEDFSFE